MGCFLWEAIFYVNNNISYSGFILVPVVDGVLKKVSGFFAQLTGVVSHVSFLSLFLALFMFESFVPVSASLLFSS